MADRLTVERACSDCSTLCKSTIVEAAPKPMPHAYLLLEWRKDAIAFYYCNQCKSSLVSNELDAAHPWSFAPVQG